ncbi:MAG: NUMOD4 domain-containing protein, partial [Reichenbachiella sp.]
MEAHKIERIAEVWKTIDGFSNYEISNLGRVRRKARKTFHAGSNKDIFLKEKVMKQRWNKTCKCYFMDLLNDEKKRKTVYPHRE